MKYKSPYSQETKERVLARLLPPKSESIKDVSISEGISEPTLRSWIRESQNEKETPSNEVANTDTSGLTSEQKFLVVMETATLDELKLGEYARSRGLFVQDIKRWIENCRKCNTSHKVEDEPAKVTSLRKELKEARATVNNAKSEVKKLNKTLQEREKALAEASAIIFLQKKTFQLN